MVNCQINLAKYSRVYHIRARMQPEERQHRIAEYLQKVEFAALEEIAGQVGASPSTVRRDLAILEVSGNIQRTHGGARVVNPRSDEFTFTSRDTHQLSEKEAIGRAAAELIPPNQSVIIDAGTTVYHVARHLESKAPQIITNSLPVANLFASANRVEVVVSGGVIYPRLGVLVGPLAVESFKKINADIAIMSAGGVSVEGVTNSHGLLIDIQRAMIDAAQKVIFCFDHTKLGRKSVSPLCDLDCIDAIVTDAGAPTELVDQLKQHGIEVIVAPLLLERSGSPGK
jgi:DeoR family fructose operon transcriptional repressor